MRKLAEVDEAKALMTEAMNWSVMRWLREKKRVRQTADKANHALWAMQKEVKALWSDDLRAAYQEMEVQPGASRGQQQGKGAAKLDPDVKLTAKRVKEADDAAYNAHMDAENTFDKAEKILSTSLAREGAKKAIDSWDLYEKAIVKAEAVVRASKATT